jgi:N-acetylmuramate 1-kinase
VRPGRHRRLRPAVAPAKRVFIASTAPEVNAVEFATRCNTRLPARLGVCQNPAMTDDESRARSAVAAAVAQRWPGAALGAPSVMAGDASSRRYLRWRLAGSGAPQSVVVMLNEGSGAALSSDELGVFGDRGPRELPFLNVQRYLAGLTDAVPAIYHVTGACAEIVLEDVGDVTLWQAAQAGDAEATFGAALALLADLQTRVTDDGSGCYAFRQSFDQRLFDWEFEHFIEHGLAGADRAALEECRAELRVVSRRLARLPRVFAHRDYHAWNIHVQHGRLRVIDFQDALLAPAAYDVASLLTDRVTPSLLNPAARLRLVDAFAAACPAERFGTVDPREAFAACALQRVLKVIGRFNYLSDVKGKPHYAQMLPAIVPTARELCAGRTDLAATATLLETCVRGGAACVR